MQNLVSLTMSQVLLYYSLSTQGSSLREEVEVQGG